MILSGISDHLPIFIKQYLTNKLLDSHATYKVRIRNRACYDNFRALLSEVNWDGICSQMNTDVMFDSFNVTLVSIYIMIHFHMSQQKIKPLDILKPYINAELRELVKEKHRIEKKSNAIP